MQDQYSGASYRRHLYRNARQETRMDPWAGEIHTYLKSREYRADVPVPGSNGGPAFGGPAQIRH